MVGPQREMESKSGLRFQKFHGLVHILRYIQKLRNTFNFFGRFLERVLKDVVKQRTKRTTRQQDNLSLELMKRNQEAEVCEAASRRLETTNYYKDDLSVNVDEEDVWKEPVQSAGYTANPAKGLHSYAFTCCLGPHGTWMTRVPGSNSDIKGSIYPKNRTAGNDGCVKAVCDDAANEGYYKVLFYYALATNSAEKGVHDIFQCHPDYRSLPNQRRSWYDSAMVQFVNDSNRTTCEPARVFVWAHFEKLDDNDNNVGPIKAVVHPLEQDEPKGDSVLFFATAGRLSKKHCIVQRESIAEVAYVLPSIEHRANAFPESVEEAEYLLPFLLESRGGILVRTS